MKAIEVSSSPEPEDIIRPRSRYPYRAKQKAKGVTESEIVDITDSDSDVVSSEVPTMQLKPESLQTQNVLGQQTRSTPSVEVPSMLSYDQSDRTAHINRFQAPPLVANSNLQDAMNPTAAFSGTVNDSTSRQPFLKPTEPLVNLEDISELGDANPCSTSGIQPVESQEEVMARAVAQILEIIPDVDPQYLNLKVQELYAASQGNLVELVLHCLFENPKYPRIEKLQKGKGKRKSDFGEGSGHHPKKIRLDDTIDYGSKDRVFTGGDAYNEMALDQLQADFPYIPKQSLRAVLRDNNSFYAPTYLYLSELIREPTGLPFALKKSAHRPLKGKERELHDEEFSKELAWVQERIAGFEDQTMDDDDHDGQAPQPYESDGEDEENGLECGCCFSKYRFEKLIQCPEAHLFCRSCLRLYATSLLGTHSISIKCMHQDGCSSLFSHSELQRVLPKKLLILYERLVQAKDIAEANIEGLEECPFCEWKCVIENPDEKLFRCGNEDGGCGVVSCRGCKKLDHLPKSCKESEQDKKLDARHAVEEAMTQALMRNCPKCKKAFIKEGGCNKMVCPNCRTLSCYLCRRIIKGYEHFNERGSKCALWDNNLDEMHANEVKKAAKKAIADVKARNPDVQVADLSIDLPNVAKRSGSLNNYPIPPQAQIWMPQPNPFLHPFPQARVGNGIAFDVPPIIPAPAAPVVGHPGPIMLTNRRGQAPAHPLPGPPPMGVALHALPHPGKPQGGRGGRRRLQP